MKAAAFLYARPGSLHAAIEMLAGEPGATPLAGGQSLLAMLNLRVTAPSLLVDLSRVCDLRGIRESGGSIRIGAMTVYREVLESAVIRSHAPLLAAALEHVAHPAIRNRGTIGGSLALADPAAEMPACMTALDASVEIAGAAGVRMVPAEMFFTGMMQTALLPGELITAVWVPIVPSQAWGFHELARRYGDYALAGLAATSRAGRLRLAYFGCSDHARLAPSVAALAERARCRYDDPALTDALRSDLGEIDTPGLRGATRLRLAAAVTCQVMHGLQA